MSDEKQALTKLDKSNLSIVLAVAAALVFFLASGFFSYRNISFLNETNQRVAQTHDVILSLTDLLSAMKDAETGQRGFLLTGEAQYLLPYTEALNAIHKEEQRLERLVDTRTDQSEISELKIRINAKLQELAHTIDVRKKRGLDAALDIVATDRGKIEMDALRESAESMKSRERQVRQERIEDAKHAYMLAVISGIAAGILGIVLSLLIGILMMRAAVARRVQEWLQAGETGLTNAMLGDQKIAELGSSILKFLAEYTGAHAGAVFIKDGLDYKKVATYGVPRDNDVPERFSEGDGLLWQAAQDRKTFILNNVPEGYLTIGSALGQDKPRQIMIAPAIMGGNCNAVLELGYINPIDNTTKTLLNQVSESMGIAVRSANYRSNLQELLEETQRQAEELQAQGEELRVSNEELEEQSRALQETQHRLEQQQAELEQTNSQLEEQTQMLETQKDDLEKSQSALQARSRELEQASQYKSDFLANMSHELRTPLNSSLILAKLLADNNEGNLTNEQVLHAQTIEAAGNDLLNLINDILDLSKIEAGHMEIIPEPVRLSKMMDDLRRTFQPLAKHKNIEFNAIIEPAAPKEIQTDGKRLEQVLKNLLSNAIKFTEEGDVTLTITATKDNEVSFSVTDTGIGISEEQQNIIFEAFRQADGTTNRKYGGTGLGLSISRELTRLLGGRIDLHSKVKKGSTFTITIPATYDSSLIKTNIARYDPPAAIVTSPKKKASKSKVEPIERFSTIEDDRDKLKPNQKVLLVVEDDEAFARILYDLAHSQNFQCLVANTADEALKVATRYMPSAVILDVGLPDHSGLSVLDRLKQDYRTRHIPVHVISANDYSQTAYALGAVGYMLKPFKRNELVDTLSQLEQRFVQRMRRVLLVEDDLVQRESVGKLLSSHDVQTVGVGTAAECLERLKNETFDCMVLDLSLPDASGYSLLEILSKEDAYSFPPVIVYTGRDLSSSEEQQLRRYSKSIIIKGAKSPERLLDEVTLFLHQVVSELPSEQQRLLKKAKNRDAILENRRILIVEDDIRNVYSLSNILEPRGAIVQIARNGKEALEALEQSKNDAAKTIDLVLMDVMMPEMDGLTATRKIRTQSEWKKLPIVMLTAKAMRDDQQRCLDAGANDYMAKPLDVEKLLSLVRVWMPR